MSTVKLAANLIQNSAGSGNWGHLQIAGGATNQEIEVQIYDFFSDFIYFRYDEFKPVERDTDGYGDPAFYREVSWISVSAAADLWTTLSKIHATFIVQSPDYLYTLGQNSNSYVNTLLWMVGLDLASYIPVVRQPTITGMDPIAAGAAATSLSAGNRTEWAAWYHDLTAWFPGSDRIVLTDGY